MRSLEYNPERSPVFNFAGLSWTLRDDFDQTRDSGSLNVILSFVKVCVTLAKFRVSGCIERPVYEHCRCIAGIYLSIVIKIQ